VGVTAGFGVGPVPTVVAVVPECRRDAVLGTGGLLVVAGLLEYDGEALGRRRILHVPVPKLGQRPALVLHREATSITMLTTDFALLFYNLNIPSSSPRAS
jgi:hypothetical protein